jgi:hypothetical protein
MPRIDPPPHDCSPAGAGQGLVALRAMARSASLDAPPTVNNPTLERRPGGDSLPVFTRSTVVAPARA